MPITHLLFQKNTIFAISFIERLEFKYTVSTVVTIRQTEFSDTLALQNSDVGYIRKFPCFQ
ncbi:hypothetical protein D7V95_04785 [bacterium J10(2018)]|nr:hypothetical protein D7V95_04785 [bacterium J10(2018)]